MSIEYTKAYFRTNAGYEWGKGICIVDGERFYTDVISLLEGIGFVLTNPVRKSGSCPVMARGKESLYCHPMDLCGFVQSENISEIENVLRAGVSFTVRSVDRFDVVIDYSNEELRDKLLEIEPVLRHRLFESFKTRRRNIYFPFYKAFGVMSKTGIPGLLHAYSNSGTQAIIASFVERVTNNLITQRYLVKADFNDPQGGPLYRARNKDEMKASRLPALASLVDSEAAVAVPVVNAAA